jgi:hypothetical protein
MRKELHTPWSDEITLLRFKPDRDSQGYILPQEPDARTVFCTFEEGVSQNEFYLSEKIGLRASASVEVWAVDYAGEEYCCFCGRFFRVIRAFQSSFDAKTLILSEVIR